MPRTGTIEDKCLSHFAVGIGDILCHTIVRADNVIGIAFARPPTHQTRWCRCAGLGWSWRAFARAAGAVDGGYFIGRKRAVINGNFVHGSLHPAVPPWLACRSNEYGARSIIQWKAGISTAFQYAVDIEIHVTAAAIVSPGQMIPDSNLRNRRGSRRNLCSISRGDLKAKDVLTVFCQVLLEVITLETPVPCVLLENNVLQSRVGGDWRRQASSLTQVSTVTLAGLRLAESGICTSALDPFK